MENEFFTVHLNHLSNADAASLISQTAEHATNVKEELGEMGNRALIPLVSNGAAFSAQVNRQQKSKYTDQVKSDRKVTIDLIGDIKRRVAFELKSRDPQKKLAATNFNFFLEPYSDITTGPLGAQIEQTQEMIVKYHTDPILISTALSLGVDTLMSELETGNIALKSIYQTRTIDTGNRGTSGTDLRPPAMQSYNQFCNVIEQVVNLMPNDTLITLFNTMDELRRVHNALIKKDADDNAPDVN